MKVSDIIIYIMKIMWRDFKKNRSSRLRALKVQVLNEVALSQVVKEHKNENTPKFPNIEIWY